MAADDKITFGQSSDTKVTNTKNNSSKAYVTGTTSSTTNTGTQVFDDGVYLTEEPGEMHLKSLEIGNAKLSFDDTYQMVIISF